MEDNWHITRAAADAALRALQAAMDGAGVPAESWQQIRIMMGHHGDVVIGGLTVAAAEHLTRALATVPRQHTVPDGGTEPDHARTTGT